MKILGIDDSIEQDIISIAIKNDIKKLILFGSRAVSYTHLTLPTKLEV